MNLRDLLNLSLLPALTYLLVFHPTNTVLYPAPAYTVFVLLASAAVGDTFGAALLGALVQSVIFVTLNLYLAAPKTERTPHLIWVPSTLAALTLAGIFIAYAPSAWSQRVDRPGMSAMLFANTALLLAGVTFSCSRLIAQPVAKNVRSVAWFNCMLHVAVVAVLFPYTGEGP